MLKFGWFHCGSFGGSILGSPTFFSNKSLVSPLCPLTFLPSFIFIFFFFSTFFLLFNYLFIFETGSCCVDQAGLELEILLP
jgi:hypothetical protein